jgi:uncharacterized protein (TIGR02246 family)
VRQHAWLTALILLIWIAVHPADARPQQAPDAGTSADFDFLVGRWDVVYNTKRPGVPPNVRGTWEGRKLADGHIIADEFRLFGPRDSVVALGTSFRVFDRNARRWTFRYIDVLRENRWHEGEGWREGADMRLDQRLPGGGVLRIRYYDITPSRFEWKADFSPDSGKTWTTDFIRIEAKRHRPHVSGTSDDRAAIDDLHQRDMRAVLAGDTSALMALWTDDIVALPPTGPIRLGRAANAAALRKDTEQSRGIEPMGYRLDFQELQIFDTSAFEWGTYTAIARTNAGAAPDTATGKVMRLLRREPDGQWKVARTMYGVER